MFTSGDLVVLSLWWAVDNSLFKFPYELGLITHCKVSLGISDLNYDLLNRHLTTNSFCDCGERKETSEHYILHRPRFTHVRQNTIFKFPANLLNIATLMQGGSNISNNKNSLLFKAVQDFIAQSGRFAMEWQTQLNSYWHKSILSLSLSWFLTDFCCCCFHVV